jgi:hypothetical protein
VYIPVKNKSSLLYIVYYATQEICSTQQNKDLSICFAEHCVWEGLSY